MGLHDGPRDLQAHQRHLWDMLGIADPDRATIAPHGWKAERALAEQHDASPPKPSATKGAWGRILSAVRNLGLMGRGASGSITPGTGTLGG